MLKKTHTQIFFFKSNSITKYFRTLKRKEKKNWKNNRVFQNYSIPNLNAKKDTHKFFFQVQFYYKIF